MIDFAEMVKDEVGKTAGSNCEIKLNDVRKNNGIVLKGLTVVENGNNIAPTIYLNDYYQDYINGRTTFVRVISDVMDTYRKNKVDKSVDMKHFLNYGKAKQNIVYILAVEKTKSTRGNGTRTSALERV